MERVGQHQHRSVTSGASTLLKRRTLTSSEEAQIVRLKAWMEASYSHQEVTPELSKVWTADWTKIIVSYGMETLVEGLRRHREASNYLPNTKELTDQVSAIRKERAAANEVERTRQMFQEEDKWKRQAQEEGVEWVHEDLLMKQLQRDVLAMRAKCEEVFGPNYRERYVQEYSKSGKLVSDFGLMQLYQQAIDEVPF